MVSQQLAAIVLSVLTLGAGAAGAATVAEGPPEEAPPPWANDDSEGAINVSVDGNVTAGESVTLTATSDGEPVPYATVSVNGETVGETAADGSIDLTVPDADEFEVEMEAEFEGEAAMSFDDGSIDEGLMSDDGEEDRIDLSIDDNVSANGSVTVTATVNDTPLAGAHVEAYGDAVGTTDTDGTIRVTVPEEAEELELEASYEKEGELEVRLAEEDEDEADDEEDGLGAFRVTVSSDGAPGGSVTVTVFQDGSPVGDVPVSVNDEVVGSTDGNGTYEVSIPADAEEIAIGVAAGPVEGEWELEFDEGDDQADENDGD